MSDQNLQNFIGLSAVLTGLSAKLLAPSVDPINLPPVFFATADEIACDIGYLLSDMSANVTGVVLNTDGGYSL